MKKSRTVYKLPDGVTSTTNVRKYVKAWDDIARPFCAMFGCDILSYGPGIQFCYEDYFFSLPVPLVQRIMAKIAEYERYNGHQLQDRCECAYVETSRWDAALQALAEVAPNHPLLKGAHPNYGVWTMMRHRLEAANDAVEACREFIRKCDSGEARSKRSYAQMKAAVEKFDQSK